MQNDMRDRLIRLIDGFVFGAQIVINNLEWTSETCKELADYLLENGVIVPPIKKVGEKLYFHQFDNEFKKVVVEGEIIKITNGEREYVVKLKDGRKLTFLISFFGKTVFLTKEEAERALAERKEKQ